MNKRLIKSNDEGGAVPLSFNTVLYTGNGGTQSITGVGFQPDLVWIKDRSLTHSHSLQDIVRGAGQNFNLYTDATNVEGSLGVYGYLSSFNQDGFSVSAGSSGAEHTNKSGDTYVAWCWKAGGAAVTNTDGSITSQVSANAGAGFSIVSYTGNGSAGATVGHGLTNAPSMYIVKDRGSVSNWRIYHGSLGATKALEFNTNAESTNIILWNNTEPTSSVFSLGTFSDVNANTKNFIAYCFAEVEGFSKFGSYTGSDGIGDNIITTEFEPAFLLIKNSTDAFNWVILDNKRSTTNPRNHRLFPDLSNAESVATSYDVDFLSTGFNVKGNATAINNSNNTYIYMAFANQF